jgi:hypothetical protein
MATADELQDRAIDAAAGYASQMQSFISSLAGLSQAPQASGWVIANPDLAAIQTALHALIAGTQLTPPALLTIPDLPTLAIPTPGAVDATVAIPTFDTISVPSITLPDAPSVDHLVFTGVREALAPLNAPVRPTLTLPDAPTFANIAMPTITDIVLPTLSAIAPTDALTEPSSLFEFSEAVYSSALLDSSKAKLLHDMENGGYGIETADEDALWARARDRELRNAAAASNEIARAMAARGFSLPPGAMLAQLASTNQEGAEKSSTVSRDIALKRADMYVENRKFTITEVRELEQLSINLHMGVMERALNVAKATTEFGIALFNAKVSKFNVLMDGYKTKVAAYAEEVRAAVSQMEAQKVKLQFAETQVAVQKAQADVYNSQLMGQRTLLDMYRTDIAALQGLADVERLKLETFRSDVEVFAEQIRAGNLQLQGYEAQLRGNVAQIDIYKAQIDAQQSRAELSKVQASVVESNAKVSIENLRASIASITASADVYRAQSAGVASANDAQSRAFAARTEAFKSIAQVYESMGTLQLGGEDMKLRAGIASLNHYNDVLKGTRDIRLGANAAALDGLGKGMQAQLGQVLGIASAITSSSS